MAYDYKRLCNELLSYLYQCNWPDGKRFYALVERTQAALAEPDPMNDLRQASADVSGVELADHFADASKMVPTQRQLLQLASEFWPEGCEPTQATAYARAVLARWGE